jgi:hypothetical protein
MGARNRGGIGSAKLHRLAEFIPWNQFRDPINIYVKVRAQYTLYTGKNRPMTAKERLLSEQFQNNVSVFKEASRNFIILFLFHKAAYQFENHLCMYRDKGLYKIFHLVTKSL